MGIKTHIPDYMRPAAGNKDVVEVEGSTVGECLDYLVRKFPAIKGNLFDKDGKVPAQIDIWVNEKSSYPQELAKQVLDGDELYILGGG